MIYHLSQRDGAPLFLHPFLKRGSLTDVTGSVELSGQYGREPRVESITMLRNELYRRIEEDVRDWINERRFVPRFLVAAAAFFVTYVFLAWVIRDPLPFVDEFIAATVVGIVSFVIVGRKFEQSKGASRRRVMLRSKVDGVVFSETGFVHDVEDLLHQLEARDPVAAFNDKPPVEATALWAAHPDDTASLLEALRQLVAQREYARLEKAIRRGSIPGPINARIESAEVSPAAVVLMHALRRAVP